MRMHAAMPFVGQVPITNGKELGLHHSQQSEATQLFVVVVKTKMKVKDKVNEHIARIFYFFLPCRRFLAKISPIYLFLFLLHLLLRT